MKNRKSSHIYSRCLKNSAGRARYLGRYHPSTIDWFKRREQIILDLGFVSYRDYVNSELWKDIRNNIRQQQKQCYLCETRGSVVHHKQYDRNTMIGKTAKHLKLLCPLCHSLIHVDDNGQPAKWITVHFKFWVKQREYELQTKRRERSDYADQIGGKGKGNGKLRKQLSIKPKQKKIIDWRSLVKKAEKKVISP